MKEKIWVKPAIIEIKRVRNEDFVLITCKDNTGRDGPMSTYFWCSTMGVCEQCSGIGPS